MNEIFVFGISSHYTKIKKIMCYLKLLPGYNYQEQLLGLPFAPGDAFVWKAPGVATR